jgi:integrase
MSQKHLTKSRHGIYLFQYWLPKRLSNTVFNMKVFRLQLNTSNRREAVKQSHRLIVLIYDLEDQYNNKPNLFGDALLKIRLRYKNMSEVDELTQSIDDYQIRYTHGLKIVNKLTGIDPTSEDIGTQEYMSQFGQYDMDCYQLVINKQLVLTTANKVAIVETNSETNEIEGKLISECLELFISSQNWGHSTETSYKEKINLFIEIVTDKPISKLTKSDVNDYSNILIKLPSNAHKKPQYKNKKVSEILEMDIPKDDPLLHPTTLTKHFSTVSEFLVRMMKDGVITDRYINEPLQGKVKKPKGDDRMPFDPDELKILFESESYILGRHGNRKLTAPNYWTPLISLLSGMRLNEICQLLKSDIKKEGEIYYFNINDKGGKKSLKNPNAERLVPIHKELIRLGFIKYVESCKTERIFPTLSYCEDNHYGGSTSKWFTRYLKKYGVWVAHYKVFHSLRYNFTTIARKKTKIPTLTLKQLIGHGRKEDITDAYTGLDDLPELNKALQKIRYDIDFSKIKKWHVPR